MKPGTGERRPPPRAPAGSLLLSETFVSLQGEGPSSGERAVFVRLAGCNLTCTWCDTRYSWDWDRYDPAVETSIVDPKLLAADLDRRAGPHTRLVVLTGGEPLLQQPAVVTLLTALRARRPDVRCEVETNGTVAPAEALVPLVYRFVVSPKLTHAGSAAARVRPQTLRALLDLPRSVLKIVLDGPGDLPQVASLAATARTTPDRIWLMPRATTTAELLIGMRTLAGLAVDNGFNLSGRTHILLWGDVRGR
ncbi:7-carboxy-7-deazaguanine synthase QueE [Virgisporangium aurantiacum]|uniref:7-carboxy-7-deazaguanine synthase n=1 Tax=Virgisporangium aurantiacum TaxID=175570 RepID=A0A8J3ZH19_9ACTN|nr:7-carboxy-7-deazaguanine synthase QueE [Virgisporangium aurantiacum]GIJ63676.1 radical SAM protein [Virgisporangium aurantiacum]